VSHSAVEERGPGTGKGVDVAEAAAGRRTSHEAGENKGVQSHGPVGLGLARRTMPLFIYLNYFKKT
jgi:hypothetical protein